MQFRMHNGFPLDPQCMANRSVSKLLAHEWAIRSFDLGAEGCCRSLNALSFISLGLTVEQMQINDVS